MYSVAVGDSVKLAEKTAGHNRHHVGKTGTVERITNPNNSHMVLRVRFPSGVLKSNYTDFQRA